MLIKQSGLSFKPNSQIPAAYIIIAQDPFQLTHIAEAIITHWQHSYPNESEVKIIDLVNASDWENLAQEAGSYSLFAQHTLIDARLDKKALEKNAQAFLNDYLQAPNPHCTILIRASQLTIKQVSELAKQISIQVIQVLAPNNQQINQWIVEQIRLKAIQFPPEIPILIQQFTEGNLSACAQLLNKLDLIVDEKRILTPSLLQAHLYNQCDYAVFELADACLRGEKTKAAQLIRQAAIDKTEGTLILWILAQELRVLIQLIALTRQGFSFRDSCGQLKIWSTRISLYQSAYSRYDQVLLEKWLQYCSLIDRQLKSHQSQIAWQALEHLALSLCIGKQVGYFA